MKEIKLEGDITVRTFASPPKGFDPFSASPKELEQAGFPPIPTDPHHLERYKRVFGRIKNKLDYIEPTLRVNHDRFHGPRKRETGAGTETSGNWSGGVVYAPAGQTFKWIEGDWIVPDVDAPTQKQWYYCASWIGIDGDGSPDVFQAGVECEVYRTGSTIKRNIYPWWEWYPIPEIQITNFNINPGDFITMILCSASAAGSTTGSVYITNRTTGLSTSAQLTAPAGTKLHGNSAEWVVEAPTVGGTQSAMADYGEVFFSVCEAFTNTGATINGGSGDNINMTAGGKVVSEGNLITPTVIQCLYTGALPT
ncbi:MAG TPA: G1 family glutamic endopeptidase [Pyrinomonadaceae bacterium]|nr:G1 family glutamic endopeptidase [Pyrinomonadaceae bacterium]